MPETVICDTSPLFYLHRAGCLELPAKFNHSDLKTHSRKEINPEIMFGKPVIKGTRITVEQILYKPGAGLSSPTM